MGSKGGVLSQIYYFKGVMAANQEEYPEAISQLRKALEILPESKKIKGVLATALNNYALSLEDAEKEKSIELLEEAVLILPAKRLLKDNLASVYNEWGLELLKEENINEAIEKFDKALDIYPAGKIYQNNLGDALKLKGFGYFNKAEFNLAAMIFNEALQYLPESSELWAMLGESYYRLDNLEEAIHYWKEAERLLPENEILKKKLAKAKKEWSVQRDFEKFDSRYFKINFTPDIRRDRIYEIYGYVNEAIWSVRYDLGFSPQQRFSIFVYSSDQFAKIFGPQKNLVGLYDGKIHLKINERTTSERMSELIRHEYAHMAIFELTQGRCPFWLNEGLARFEEKKGKAVDFSGLKRLARQNRLIPLSELSEAFSRLEDIIGTNLAYSQVHSLVKYIIDGYGFWKVRKMLALFGKGKAEREVIKEVLRIEPEDLEENWRKKLVYE